MQVVSHFEKGCQVELVETGLFYCNPPSTSSGRQSFTIVIFQNEHYQMWDLLLDYQKICILLANCLQAITSSPKKPHCKQAPIILVLVCPKLKTHPPKSVNHSDS
jgi:hypothetical protein